MPIAIISDIHNNEVNLKKVLDYCAQESAGRRIETIICCGDLASLETLDFLNDNFSGNILYTFGNADHDDLRALDAQKKYKKTYLYKDFGEAVIRKTFEVSPRETRGETSNNSVNIAFTHYPDRAKSLARTGKYDFVFYGHTHKPWEVMSGNCKLLNPGTTAGEIYPPTFAIWNTDDDSFKLIRIHELK